MSYFLLLPHSSLHKNHPVIQELLFLLFKARVEAISHTQDFHVEEENNLKCRRYLCLAAERLLQYTMPKVLTSTGDENYCVGWCSELSPPLSVFVPFLWDFQVPLNCIYSHLPS